jgi:DNA replicative helicase MCM subunit Mcm2 (Cdc46/Mcm family)
MSTSESEIKSLENIGHRPIGLFENHTPGISWGEKHGVYNDPLFCWSTSDKVLEDRRYSLPNIATMLGRTHKKEAVTGEYYNLNVLDTDSVTVANRLKVPIRTIVDASSYDWVTDRLRNLIRDFLNEEAVVNGNPEETLLDVLMKSGYVTKTRKEYGYHPYWLSLKQNAPIGAGSCLPGKEFELKTNDKYGLCTLPGSTHRDDPNFRYKAVGRTDINLVSNILYDLFAEMYKDCLVDAKLDDEDDSNNNNTNTKNNNNNDINSSANNRTVNIKNPVVLSESAIMVTAGQMSQFIKKGYRHFFNLKLSGMMFHARIAEESGAKVIARLCAIINDEEASDRQGVFTGTYEKGFNGEEIEGAPKLAELIAAKIAGQDVIATTAMLDSLKVIWRNDKKVKRQREESKLVSVSIADAKRMQTGYVQVRGSIVGMSTVYHMYKSVHVTCEDCSYDEPTTYEIPQHRPHVKARFRCPNQSKDHAKGDTAFAEYEHVSTVDIELQDLDHPTGLDRLRIKLFDNNTNDVNTGEIVDVIGHIHIVRNNDSLMNRPESVLFCEDLIYAKRKEIELTEQDRRGIQTWKCDLEKQGKSVIDEAVSLIAPEMIGYGHMKKGMLIQCANAGIRNDSERMPIRMRINTLYIGDPGTAKGALSSWALKLIPNCQSVSAIATSGISLITVINRDSGGTMSANLGPLALAKDGIAKVNELGRLKFDQQTHLFDAMEEGTTNMVKYGFPANIECHASMLATANPVDNKWKHHDKVTVEEFPILLQVIQRFDLIFIFREIRDPDFIDGYTKTRNEVARNYKAGMYRGNIEKLQKYLAYARMFNPIVSEDAERLLNYFLVQMAKTDVDGIFRKYDSLLRISIGIARLKLKNVVDVQDANEAMQIIQFMLGAFKHHVGITRDPRDVTYHEIRQIVKETYNIVPGGITLRESIEKACERKSQVNDYLRRGIGEGKDYLNLGDNIKLRPILELLRKDPNIIFVGERPIVMKWNPDGNGNDENVTLSDVSDVSDATLTDPFEQDNIADTKKGNQNVTSETSLTSDSK